MESIRRALNPLPSEEYREWDRLKSESAKAFSAFVDYRDLGLERTLKKVAEKQKKSLALMGRWAIDFSWKARARAYDIHADRMVQQELLKERAKARRSAV